MIQTVGCSAARCSPQRRRTLWGMSTTGRPLLFPATGSLSGWIRTSLIKPIVQHLLKSLPEPTLTPRIVSPRVNSVRHNGPELIEPASVASGDEQLGRPGE